MNTVYAMDAEEPDARRTRLQLLADLHRARRPLPESFSPEGAEIDAGATLQRTAAQVIVLVSDAYGIPELEAAELLASLGANFFAERERLAA